MNCFLYSPEEFHLALSNNSMPYLLGVRNGNSSFIKLWMFKSSLPDPNLFSFQVVFAFVWELRHPCTMRSERRVRRCGSAICWVLLHPVSISKQTQKVSPDRFLLEFIFFFKLIFTLFLSKVCGKWCRKVKRSLMLISTHFSKVR